MEDELGQSRAAQAPWWLDDPPVFDVDVAELVALSDLFDLTEVVDLSDLVALSEVVDPSDLANPGGLGGLVDPDGVEVAALSVAEVLAGAEVAGPGARAVGLLTEAPRL